jgi:tol-pal system-associated acyl-CoA thioesterase
MSPNFCTNYRVYFEDTDAGGVVYYANYLKFFERARTDFLRARGIFQSDLAKAQNLAFVVRKCEIEYLSPARLDDLIEVSVLVKEKRAASLKMQQEISRDGKILSRLNVEIVCVSADEFKPKKLPEVMDFILNHPSVA